jgi:predicted nucleic acid-binding Zn ribbon protein
MMERLGGEIRHELARFGPAAGIAEILDAWPAAVGDAIARNAWPARIARDGTLTVHTQDSVWAFELTQRAQEVLGRLGDAAPTAIRFVAGPVPEPSVEPNAEAGAQPIEAGPEQLAEAASLAAAIDDENLRKVVAKAAALGLTRAAAGRVVW